MVETEIRERLLENALIAIKFGCTVDRYPSIKCNNFQFNPISKSYKIKSKECNVLETILFDVQDGSGDWVLDVSKELGINIDDLEKFTMPDSAWKAR